MKSTVLLNVIISHVLYNISIIYNVKVEVEV